MGQAVVPLMIGSTLFSARGALDEGSAIRTAKNYTADQLVANAGQQRAAGQAQGEEDLRKTKVIQSRILALAGASGAGVTDPTVVHLAAQTQAEGHLAAAMHRYNAESNASSMEAQATADRYEGDAYARAGKWKAAGTALSMASLFR